MDSSRGLSPMKQGRQYVNPNKDDQMSPTNFSRLHEIECYKLNKVKNVILWICVVLTLGFLRLFFYWLPHLMVIFTHDKCPLSKATKVLLKDQYEQWFVANVKDMEDSGIDGVDGNNHSAMK
ncbi:hypothetical protein KUTeg_002381 [Tegillarca granosa]|uniref:Cation-transporting ATPase n=1 Tax=Tegillarca granosa TaxID=220873 RepID=A0ABQ9FU53_TEGGR|nr:hypothetical protein KUTeg_002381 [Tegillarca granosa]